MKKQKKSWTRGDWFRFVVLALAAFFLLAVTVVLSRWIFALKNPDTQQWFQDVITGLGIKGWFVMLAIQYFQIVLAFVPGGPIQVLAGLLYGPWGGLALSLTGTVLATGTIYYLIQKFSPKIIQLFVGEEELSRYRFLHQNPDNTPRLEQLVLILFFIPGTPKDALTYLFALTPLPFHRFLALSTIARLPAMMTSILAGKYISEGRWIPTVVTFVCLALVSGVGLLIHRKVMQKEPPLDPPEKT